MVLSTLTSLVVALCTCAAALPALAEVEAPSAPLRPWRALSEETEREGSGEEGGEEKGRDEEEKREVPIPRVEVAPVTIGDPPMEPIRRVFRSHEQELRSCYVEGLRRNPWLEGKLRLQLDISAEGEVIAASVTSSTMNDASFEGCVIEACERWRFPKMGGGGVIRVTYPYLFTP